MNRLKNSPFIAIAIGLALVLIGMIGISLRQCPAAFAGITGLEYQLAGRERADAADRFRTGDRMSGCPVAAVDTLPSPAAAG